MFDPFFHSYWHSLIIIESFYLVPHICYMHSLVKFNNFKGHADILMIHSTRENLNEMMQYILAHTNIPAAFCWTNKARLKRGSNVSRHTFIFASLDPSTDNEHVNVSIINWKDEITNKKSIYIAQAVVHVKKFADVIASNLLCCWQAC